MQKTFIQILRNIDFHKYSTGPLHAIYTNGRHLSDNMVVLTDMVIPLLFLLICKSHLAFVEDDIVDFLEDQGLQELSAGFVSEEIEVRHLPSIPDNLLAQLGIRTMVARLNLRSAATAWLTQNQVQDSGSGQVRAF